MLFLVYVVPGLNTALAYRQTDDLHFAKDFHRTARQRRRSGRHRLRRSFTPPVCTRFNLRTLIILTIAVNALGTLLFLDYNASTAYLVHATVGAVSVLSELSLMDLAVRSTPRGCEALGFALMISVRNFGIAMSDVFGSKLMDQAHFRFNTLVLLNVGTTLAVLLFVPALPRALVLRKEGDGAMAR